MVHPGSTLVWFLACEFLAGHLICDEELGQLKISTIKIAGQVCVAFRACKARAAACTVNNFTPQLHTLQKTKSWSVPGNEARV